MPTLFTCLLDVDFNVLLQVVAVQIEDEVVNVIKTIADNDQRQLICQLCLLDTQTQQGNATFTLSLYNCLS